MPVWLYGNNESSENDDLIGYLLFDTDPDYPEAIFRRERKGEIVSEADKLILELQNYGAFHYKPLESGGVQLSNKKIDGNIEVTVSEGLRYKNYSFKILASENNHEVIRSLFRLASELK